jgi:hypothetical protein
MQRKWGDEKFISGLFRHATLVRQYKSDIIYTLLFLTLHVSTFIKPSSGGNTCTLIKIELANALHASVCFSYTKLMLGLS